jgi:hypothetical protein
MVEALPGSKIDGVCFWLNEVSPVVAVSSRFDRIDNFWFVLRHELEHVDRRHGLSAVMLDTELEGDRAGIGDGVAEEARVAHEAAAEFGLPKRMMDALIARKAPFFYEHDIRGFAATMNVHPRADGQQWCSCDAGRTVWEQVPPRQRADPASDGFGPGHRMACGQSDGRGRSGLRACTHQSRLLGNSRADVRFAPGSGRRAGISVRPIGASS